MTDIVAVYEQAKAKADETYRTVTAIRDANPGLSWQEKAELPAQKEAWSQYIHLHLVAERLAAPIMLENFKRLGLVDRSYGVKLRGSSYGPKAGEYLAGALMMPLTLASSLGYEGLAHMLAIEDKTSLEVVLFDGDQRVGVITCNGRVQLDVGTLKEVLGYCIATDGGHYRLLGGIPLDTHVAQIQAVIKAEGTCRHSFFEYFMPLLTKIYRNQCESMFGDGYCGVAWCLWKAATRELGQEHPGYEFAF